jgi:hypothetical protein
VVRRESVPNAVVCVLFPRPKRLKKGDINPHWFGEDVGYHGIHSWGRRNKLKTELCENCLEYPPYDLANISGEYKRDVDDYKWLCRKCHMKEDGRLDKLKKAKRKSKLTEYQVMEIKLLLFNKKELQKDIAKKFNIDKSMISGINIGRNWSRIKINQNQKEVLNGI